MSDLTTNQSYALDEAFRVARVGGIARGLLHKTVAPVVAQMLADERERIAREIEASISGEAWRSGYAATVAQGKRAAARIARGQ